MERVVPGDERSLGIIQMNIARRCAAVGVFVPVDLDAHRLKMDRMVLKAISPTGIFGVLSRLGRLVCVNR